VLVWGQWWLFAVCSGRGDARGGGSERLGSGQVVAAGGSPPSQFERGRPPSRHGCGAFAARERRENVPSDARPTMLPPTCNLSALISTNIFLSLVRVSFSDVPDTLGARGTPRGAATARQWLKQAKGGQGSMGAVLAFWGLGVLVIPWLSLSTALPPRPAARRLGGEQDRTLVRIDLTAAIGGNHGG
jgi:hypothetical protein